MTEPDGKQKPISNRYAIYIFSLLFVLYMFDYMDRLVIVSLFPYFKQEWGLTDTECGLLVSAVYWSILAFAFPASILVDRWSRSKSIGIMAVLWSLATLSCAFTRSFRQIFTARLAIGIGEAGYAPGGTAMISALFGPEKRAVLLGIWNASIPLGSALGIAVGGLVAQYFGWRHAFGLVALPGLIIGILFFFARDYRTVELVHSVEEHGRRIRKKMSFSELAGQFIYNKSLIFNNLAFAANVFVTTALLSWLPTYFNRIEGLAMGKAGPKGGVVMMMAIVGAPLGGYLADKWRSGSKPTARMIFPAISSTVTAVLLFLAFTVFRETGQYIILLASGLAAVAFVPAAVAVTQDVVHPGLRATSLAVNVVVQHLLGSSLGPIFVGAISDRFGLQTALATLPVFCLLAGVLFFAGSFSYLRDAANAEQATVEL
ncbi:MAG: MFS transporter [Desulfohalobiaceae bacterium]|nr:MFS transporter [Desulfohalobiaceae bacterium]